MKKFKIDHSFPLSGKKLHLLNQPFYKTDLSERIILGRRSTYHQKEEFKADWVVYPELLTGSLIICSSEEEYSFEEALLFTAYSNGIGITRDNLFAGINLFVEEILPQIDTTVHIAAFMAPELLPKHLSYEDRRICPVIEVEKKDVDFPLSTNNVKGNYDWYWIDQQFTPYYKFAFFKPKTVPGLY